MIDKYKWSRTTLSFLHFFCSDAHDKIFMEVPNKCTTSSGCDRDAFCACGTVSGQYQCVCKQGYYGAGIPGQCFRKSDQSKDTIRIVALPLHLPYRYCSRLTLSLASSKSTFSQLPKEKCISEVVRIGSIILFHLSNL